MIFAGKRIEHAQPGIEVAYGEQGVFLQVADVNFFQTHLSKRPDGQASDSDIGPGLFRKIRRSLLHYMGLDRRRLYSNGQCQDAYDQHEQYDGQRPEQYANYLFQRTFVCQTAKLMILRR